MDLLGSIMSSMDKPPCMSEKEKEIMKKRREEIEKRQKAEKERLKKFKEDIEKEFDRHFGNEKNRYLKFQPLDQIYRSVIHEIAEAKGFISYAFGNDGIDRYVRVYRKETPPCDDELAARRRGDPWSEDIRRDLQEKRRRQKLEDAEYTKKRKEEGKFVPNTNYKDKYVHLIGQDAALEAAKKTETNKTYGFVPSENKKDQRSIEQTLADIRAKKKQKTTNESQQPQE